MPQRLTNLKYASRIVCLAAVVASTFHLSTLGNITIASIVGNTVIVGLSIIAAFIAFRSKESQGRYLYALFIAFYILNAGWLYNTIVLKWLRIVLYNLEAAFTGVLYVLANQHFPQQTTLEDVKEKIGFRPLRSYLLFLLKRGNLWKYAFLFLFIVGSTLQVLHISPLGMNVCIILTGLCYIYISYNGYAISSRNSLLWLFWGVLSYVILILLAAIVSVFLPLHTSLFYPVISICKSLVLFIMVFMSVFFADTFDTGFIIKRTVVDGSLFILVVLIYNVAEHYLLHVINEHFEINNTFTASLLSGILVLTISPLHHKMEVYLNSKFKKNTNH
ncbi:hypothetical protein [Mucilaginibacter ginkgonis]|uniref:Uncharacterized protein n=1 Tax=Mucilaginibacter ginkgonis TaxID=2682091 RepID=A0A6I4HVF6_9SPHI|nr:hypothetical protein [Mucilaginibacter ginkgonis]QQL49921.1 hypothetical protein GO620_000270 [Mucilaginibacter ginkgonis]